MRIAFLVNELRHRGAQRVLVGDANSFARAGARVLVCTLYRQGDTPTIAGDLDAEVEHIVLDARGPFDVGAVLRCASLLKARGIDALITTLNDGNIFGRWVAIASGPRLRLFRREANTPRRKAFWQRSLDVVLDGVADRILAVSEDVRRDIIRRAPWRARKVTLLRNAAPVVSAVTPSHRAAPRILTVGRLTRQKDHATFVAALGAMAREGLAFTARVVGDGELLEPLRDRARGAGLADRLTFCRLLSHHETLREYAEADIFALSSRWEGCPTVILEAMAHGVPVVATSVGGVPELVEDGVSGMLVPPEDPDALAQALARLTRDRDLRLTMGLAARQRAAHFDPAVRFAHLSRLVQSAVGP